MRKLIIVLALTMVAGGATAGTEFSGFVDAAHTWNPADQAGEFSLDQFELDIMHRTGANTMLRADLEWVKDGEEFVAQIEQGFMTYTSPCGNVLTFGKFNAPIGFELLDAPDMFQYSHALVFDYGLPTNLTGASVARDFGNGLDAVAYVANGWDANTMAGKNVTVGGRLGFSTGGFTVGASTITGKQEVDGVEIDPEYNLLHGDAGDPTLVTGVERVTFDVAPVPLTRTVFDVDLGYQSGKWTFGGEINQGTATTVTPLGETYQDWFGYLLMGHIDYLDWAGLTVRYDYFDDPDGWAFDDVGGEFQQRQAFTISPTFTIDENCGALLELRIDKSDLDGFLDADGKPTDMQTTVAFEMTYSF